MTKGRPDSLIRSSSSRAPGTTCAVPPSRWTSVPSTSNTKPPTSSRRTAPHHHVGALLEPHVAHRLAPLDLLQETHERGAGGLRSGRHSAPHRVHLLLRHRQ